MDAIMKLVIQRDYLLKKCGMTLESLVIEMRHENSLDTKKTNDANISQQEIQRIPPSPRTT
jgi:hypothetical protein